MYHFWMSKNFWDEVIKASTSDVRRLSSVWRYSSVPVAVQENVAEHSYWVALYGAMIHRALDPNVGILGHVVLKSLLHDLGECVTGDVVRIFKYSTPELKVEVDRESVV